MRRTTTTCLLAATLTLLAGCSVPDSDSGSSAPAPVEESPDGPRVSSAAQKLADLDGGVRDAAQYQKVLDSWASRCKESERKLAGYAYATVDDLRKNGINDETQYSALVHLKGSTPAGSKTKCEDVAAAYLVMRENGKS
jgi:hypothetical protein